MRLYLAERIKIDANGCHIWQPVLHHTGYGQFTTSGPPRSHMAHRAAYAAAYGRIPEGLEIDHLCRVPACINPAHLEAVTQVENNRRSTSPTALNARKTHCDRGGHPLSGDNLYVDPKGCRTCRTCRRAVARETYRLKRAAANA